MNLPANDAAFLTERAVDHEIALDGGMTCVILRGFALPAGFDQQSSDLLIRLSPGYPDVNPDMWWFSPAIRLANGEQLPATGVAEIFFGRSWQRWSRHLNPGQWRSGVDGLQSYLALVRQELQRCVVVTAA